MEALTHFASLIAASAVSTLLSAVWEGAVLAACVVICLRLFPGLSAAARSVIWMNVFLLLMLLQIIPNFGAHVSTAGWARPAPFHFGLIWSSAIAAVWATLLLLRAAQLIYCAFRSHRLARRATPVTVDAELQPLLQIGTAGGKVGRSAELCISQEIERPSVFGFFHPRVLLPPVLMERLSEDELRQVVLHEMEHLRRADDWTNLLQKIALVLFPLNPALLWVEQRLCAERELACDDSVLRSTSRRKAYAICLTHLAEYSMLRRSFSLVLGAWERQSELVRRVHRVLRRPNNSMNRGQTLALTTCLMAGILAGGIALARSPQLVSFVPREQTATQAHFSPAVNLPALNRSAINHEQSGMQASAQMVKAVMPDSSHQLGPTAKLAGSALKPVRRNAVMRSARKNPAPAQQAWIVMTEWSETEDSPQLILTVARTIRNTGNGRSYAAVPTPNGWLLVEI
jgi:beta-lactamase regulating signal transducer with metallopeptidase domain